MTKSTTGMTIEEQIALVSKNMRKKRLSATTAVRLQAQLERLQKKLNPNPPGRPFKEQPSNDSRQRVLDALGGEEREPWASVYRIQAEVDRRAKTVPPKQDFSPSLTDEEAKQVVRSEAWIELLDSAPHPCPPGWLESRWAEYQRHGKRDARPAPGTTWADVYRSESERRAKLEDIMKYGPGGRPAPAPITPPPPGPEADF
jgi:hypothetical protein